MRTYYRCYSEIKMVPPNRSCDVILESNGLIFDCICLLVTISCWCCWLWLLCFMVIYGTITFVGWKSFSLGDGCQKESVPLIYLYSHYFLKKVRIMVLI